MKEPDRFFDPDEQTGILTEKEEPSIPSADLLADAVALLRAAKCPNCNGSGGIPRQTMSRQLVTREMASDAGCPEMEGSLYSDNEWELEQCQWCDEVRRLSEQCTANTKARI